MISRRRTRVSRQKLVTRPLSRCRCGFCWLAAEDSQPMTVWSAQFPHHPAHFTLLEQSYSGDPRRARLHAGHRVLCRDTTKSEDGNLLAARLAQCVEASRASIRGGLLVKNRTKDSEIGAMGRGARATLSPNLSDFSGGNVVSAQMHAVGATGEGNVCAGVY